jgi:hypothetical protein
MAAIRRSIRDGNFAELAARVRNAYPSPEGNAGSSALND